MRTLDCWLQFYMESQTRKKKPTVLFCVAKSAARLVDESCLPDGYNIHKTLFVIAKSHAR